MRRALVALAGALALAACHPPAKATGAGPGPAAAGKPTPESQAFLDKAAREPGVRTLPSGLMYKVVRSGPATGIKPQPGDEVKVNYEGKLVNGQVFDSTYERGAPAAMPLAHLVPAWMEALPMMRPGDEWVLYVPPKLGYGDQGAGGVIPPGAALIFRIELIDVLPAPGRVQQG
ncbi:MAG TPA: FKBP-type peptidyl-prolyl cis-trans isomerase [Phenylobacterium sp.]|uniref:FKBP-type peptidyl-prolyl cis-trans isomerase n=1 Tax=Phenylobacterium sp. TaxID=1871053 RepID=UPI002CFD0120|nr:FKBP-type peptidyl-prolyl cis-trans isomerase [Phenylobacterium sp.]HSV01770.1 FKBP-type peptidyl-prolyl cis-trans isomerase [Phenylobacterium sp.]